MLCLCLCLPALWRVNSSATYAVFADFGARAAMEDKREHGGEPTTIQSRLGESLLREDVRRKVGMLVGCHAKGTSDFEAETLLRMIGCGSPDDGTWHADNNEPHHRAC